MMLSRKTSSSAMGPATMIKNAQGMLCCMPENMALTPAFSRSNGERMPLTPRLMAQKAPMPHSQPLGIPCMKEVRTPLPVRRVRSRMPINIRVVQRSVVP